MVTAATHLLLCLGLGALLAMVWWLRPPSMQPPRARVVTGWLIAAAALVSAPALVVLALGDDEMLITGTEGLLEVFTEALLIAIVVISARARQWLITALALVIFLEEVDYFQWVLGFETPSILLAHSQSTTANTHNLGGASSLVWRVGPTLSLLVLSARPFERPRLRWLETTLRRLGLPTLHRGLGWALLCLIPLAVLTYHVAGPRRVNESMELAMVAIFIVAYAHAHATNRRAAAGQVP